MSTIDPNGTTGNTPVTFDLSDDERYAAVFAIVSDAKSLATSIVETAGKFLNAPRDRSDFFAHDIVSEGRSLANLLPALAALIDHDAREDDR